MNEQTGARDVSSTVQSVLSEMVSQIPSVVATTRRLKPEVRDKFMSLSETAARLYMQARRPPRFDRNISCRVTISVASSEAPQKCSTLNVSQRGASVETTHAFQSLQVVTLQREDTGMRASAKVVWVKKRTAKTFMVGLEIMDHDDFWGLGNLAPATVAPILPKTASEPKTIKKTK